MIRRSETPALNESTAKYARESPAGRERDAIAQPDHAAAAVNDRRGIVMPLGAMAAAFLAVLVLGTAYNFFQPAAQQTSGAPTPPPAPTSVTVTPAPPTPVSAAPTTDPASVAVPSDGGGASERRTASTARSTRPSEGSP